MIGDLQYKPRHIAFTSRSGCPRLSSFAYMPASSPPAAYKSQKTRGILLFACRSPIPTHRASRACALQQTASTSAFNATLRTSCRYNQRSAAQVHRITSSCAIAPRVRVTRNRTRVSILRLRLTTSAPAQRGTRELSGRLRCGAVRGSARQVAARLGWRKASTQPIGRKPGEPADAYRCPGAAVSPLQVVEADQDRLTQSGLLEQRLDVLQEPVTLLAEARESPSAERSSKGSGPPNSASISTASSTAASPARPRRGRQRNRISARPRRRADQAALTSPGAFDQPAGPALPGRAWRR